MKACHKGKVDSTGDMTESRGTPERHCIMTLDSCLEHHVVFRMMSNNYDIGPSVIKSSVMSGHAYY